MINLDFLNKNVIGTFSTIDGDLIQTRMFQSLWVEGNKAFFCTGAKKDVFKELTKNNSVAFCTENNQSPVVSINGFVTFVEDIKYKEKAFKVLPMLEKIYASTENPDFKVFYINIKEVKTFSFEEGPKKYTI